MGTLGYYGVFTNQRLHIPNTAMVSDTTNIFQNDLGRFSRPEYITMSYRERERETDRFIQNTYAHIHIDIPIQMHVHIYNLYIYSI